MEYRLFGSSKDQSSKLKWASQIQNSYVSTPALLEEVGQSSSAPRARAVRRWWGRFAHQHRADPEQEDHSVCAKVKISKHFNRASSEKNYPRPDAHIRSVHSWCQYACAFIQLDQVRGKLVARPESPCMQQLMNDSSAEKTTLRMTPLVNLTRLPHCGWTVINEKQTAQLKRTWITLRKF